MNQSEPFLLDKYSLELLDFDARMALAERSEKEIKALKTERVYRKTEIAHCKTEIAYCDTMMAVISAVLFYCSETQSELSPFTDQELETIAKEVAEIQKRNKVSLGSALGRYREDHLDDPRSDIFDAKKMKYWKPKARAGSRKGSNSSAAPKKRGDVA